MGLTIVGDVLKAQRDLAGARKDYEEGRAIIQKVAAADPTDTGYQGDVAVSANRLGVLR